MTNQELHEESTTDVGPKTTGTHNLADKLPAIGWSLFFIWVGIVLLMKLDAGDGMSCGAENPSGYEIEKNFCRRNREYWEKVLNYRIPCRSNNCIHANLPVLSLFPVKTSEGWYVCIDKSLKLAA